METEIMIQAIKNKKDEISRLEQKYANHQRKNQMNGLSNVQSKNWRKHYLKKIQFYKTQEKTKWLFWPNKLKKRKSIKNSDKKKRKIDSMSKTILEQRQVINLMDFAIPPAAIVVLSKGLGFVPTPKKVDVEELRLDARLFTNKLAFRSINQTQESNFTPTMPSKLKNVNYKVIKPPTTDTVTNNVINNISSKVDNIKVKNKAENNMNLSKLEEEGLEWLQEKTSNMEIIVDTADKGGAILVYSPLLAEKKITEKVSDKKLYQCLHKDPSEDIYDKLMDIWKVNNFITADEANKVVGLTQKNMKSTTSLYKPGETYFNPSLKIHKMNVEDIKPGCDPPARLITCLQDGVTSRSDIYIAEKWLKPLQKDFCNDIVEDSIDVLIWLDDLDRNSEQDKKRFKPFTFDFAALYDSLTPDLVRNAIKHAIQIYRPQWKNDFIDWILKLIDLSMTAGFGKFRKKWYRPATGIPTGGNISVQLANIAVFYALHMTLFSKPQMMRNIASTIRFIDDGSGIYICTADEFEIWKNEFTQGLKQFNLTIKNEDWDVGKNPGDMVHILDISFGCVDLPT